MGKKNSAQKTENRKKMQKTTAEGSSKISGVGSEAEGGKSVGSIKSCIRVKGAPLPEKLANLTQSNSRNYQG